VTALQIHTNWFKHRGWKAFKFQQECLRAYMDGYSGLLNAPTGSGKTYAMALPVLIASLLEQQKGVKQKGLQLLWISPVRALAAEIKDAVQTACNDLGLDWKVDLRTGDTSTAQRAHQKKTPPQCLITTPESLHLMLAQKHYNELFKNLRCVVVDEWHELIGNKRGVQVELGLSRLRGMLPELRTWGISATIGNLDEAMEVLLGMDHPKSKIIKAEIEKKLEIETIIPEEIETFPWAGHLGIKLIHRAVDIINKSRSTLVFTNTRSQAEIWYQRLLEVNPEWAGIIALHHGSLSAETRKWVEEALDLGLLKVVVCTSSLDLGVDFRPVETVIQVGSPKGVARFAQRAGRSGHAPGQVSRIYLLPTNALELIEAAAFKEAFRQKRFESRMPVVRAFDVLIQYLVTLAVSDGFYPPDIYKEVKQTFAYNSIDDNEWGQLLDFIRFGGETLRNYNEFNKVEVEDGLWIVKSRMVAMRHRLSIGTIASDSMITVQYMTGKRIGAMEEYFISKLKPGDTFTFSGRTLELVMIRDMKAWVRNGKGKSIVPSWMGGRMPLSSEVSEFLRMKLDEYVSGKSWEDEMLYLTPLFEIQKSRSAIPHTNELLIEFHKSKEGSHLFFFPFEGRLVHEGMAMLLAYRISKSMKITFSLAMNDYGFELLTDAELHPEDFINNELFSTDKYRDCPPPFSRYCFYCRVGV
jgi:ATP-dependent Lhr-like helicase